jgi:hypothetical protein
MTWDKIIEGLVEIQIAIEEKFGDDGKEQQSNGGRLYKDGPGGFDRIQYEAGRIAEAIRHSTIGAKTSEIGALIPGTLPQADGRYVLVVSDGVLSWEAEQGGQ